MLLISPLSLAACHFRFFFPRSLVSLHRVTLQTLNKVLSCIHLLLLLFTTNASASLTINLDFTILMRQYIKLQFYVFT